MLNLASGNYSHQYIREQLFKNREIDFKYELLNNNNKTLGTVSAEGFISVNSESQIKRVARFEVIEKGDVDFLNSRLRPYMGIKIDGRYIWYPLGIFLLESPSRQAKTGYITRSIEAYDLSIILRDDCFTDNYSIPKGTSYTNAIIQILADAGIINYYITPSTLVTPAAVEFEIGTSRLTAINQLAKAINYNELYVDVTGCFRIEAYIPYEERKADGSYSTDESSVILPGGSESIDLFNVPNVIVRYRENAETDYIRAEAINDDPNSQLSTIRRGRHIVDVAPVYDIADQATLNAYTRRLVAESKLYKTLDISTGLMPHHGVNDCLYIRDRQLNVSGKYIETAWNMQLQVGASMSHTLKKVET